MRLVERVGDLDGTAQRLVERQRAARRGARPASRPPGTPSPGSRVPSCAPMSNTGQMCGWLSAASVRASRSKRCFKSAFVGDVRGQHLDRDGAVQARVARAIDLAHAAAANRVHHLVRPQAKTGLEDTLDRLDVSAQPAERGRRDDDLDGRALDEVPRAFVRGQQNFDLAEQRIILSALARERKTVAAPAAARALPGTPASPATSGPGRRSCTAGPRPASCGCTTRHAPSAIRA